MLLKWPAEQGAQLFLSELGIFPAAQNLQEEAAVSSWYWFIVQEVQSDWPPMEKVDGRQSTHVFVSVSARLLGMQ